MTQDFANRARKKNPPAQTGSPRWVWFLTGFTSGAFLSFLGMLWYFVGLGNTSDSIVEKPVAEPNQVIDEMQWDFYEIFPKSVVPVVEEYNESGQKVLVKNYRWLLQAGSFKDPIDADELRAQLLLLGFDVTIQKTEIDGSPWHRVIAGPFDTDLERNRAQDKLAQAEIQSIALKIQK